MLLPLLEERAELVGSGTPVGVAVKTGGKGFGLFHDDGAFGHCLGHGCLTGLGKLGLLGRALFLQGFELRLEGRQITDDGRLFGLFGQGLQRVVDFAGLDAAGLEPVRKQVELGLEIEVTACIQCQGLFFGGIRELADLTFSLCLLDEYGAVIGDASESLGGFDISLGEAGAGGCRSRVGRSLLGECGGGWGVRLHRCRAWNGRFAGLGCGRRRLLGDFIGVLGRGDILVGHGQLL